MIDFGRFWAYYFVGLGQKIWMKKSFGRNEERRARGCGLGMKLREEMGGREGREENRHV